MATKVCSSKIAKPWDPQAKNSCEALDGYTVSENKTMQPWPDCLV